MTERLHRHRDFMAETAPLSLVLPDIGVTDTTNALTQRSLKHSPVAFTQSIDSLRRKQSQPITS